jgi:hypothetical protein
MKKIKYYTVEEASAIIEADEKLKAGLEKLRPEYEDEENRMDYGLEYCDFFSNWDSDEDYIPICIGWGRNEDVADDFAIEVETLEQAIVIVRDIEEAQGNIEP